MPVFSLKMFCNTDFCCILCENAQTGNYTLDDMTMQEEPVVAQGPYTQAYLS